MPSRRSEVLSRILMRLGAAVERLSPEELSLLEKEGTEVVISVRLPEAGREAPTRQQVKSKAAPDDELAAIAQRLEKSASRESARRELELADLSKKDLEKLARNLGLPARREPVDVLVSAIIDGTVGFRLRSQAIRGQGVGAAGVISGPSPGEADPAKPAVDHERRSLDGG